MYNLTGHTITLRSLLADAAKPTVVELPVYGELKLVTGKQQASPLLVEVGATRTYLTVQACYGVELEWTSPAGKLFADILTKLSTAMGPYAIIVTRDVAVHVYHVWGHIPLLQIYTVDNTTMSDGTEKCWLNRITKAFDPISLVCNIIGDL